MSKTEDRFLAGAAWALGVLAGIHDQPRQAAMIAQEGGFSLKDFQDNESVEDYDLQTFAEELKILEANDAKRRPK